MTSTRRAEPGLIGRGLRRRGFEKLLCVRAERLRKSSIQISLTEHRRIKLRGALEGERAFGIFSHTIAC